MIIKDILKKKKKNYFNNFLKVYFIFSFLLIILFVPIFFNSGIWINNKENFLHRFYFNGLNHYSNIFEIKFKSFKNIFNQYEEINIDLPYESLIVLEQNRKNILKNARNSMRSKNQEFKLVQGFITFENKKVPVKLRLKGDRITHYNEKNKTSYKVEVLADEKIKGIKKFSFIKPRARNYIHEWLFHELSGVGKLIKLKYEFIYLKINGENHGLYVFEENFDKDLVERNQRRNGPIFSVDQSYNKNIFDTKLQIYNQKFWERDENIKLTNYASSKLLGFFENKFSLKETFDIKKWAFLFALADLTYTYHGLAPHNTKFFYNPLSGLFEPIPFDGHRVLKNYNKNIINFDQRSIYEMVSPCKNNDQNCINKNEVDYFSQWINKFFLDEKNNLNSEFYLEYIKAIQKITNEEFLSNFLSIREKEISKINSAIYSDYYLVDNLTYSKYGPGLYYFSTKDLFYRAKVLREKIKTNLGTVSIFETRKSVIIDSYNTPNNMRLLVDQLICEKNENNWRKNLNYKIQSNEILINRIEVKKNTSYLKNSKCIYVKFIDKIENKTYLKKISHFSHVSANSNINQKNYLKYFNKKNKILSLKNKITEIKEDIVIPKDLKIKIKSGETINITNNAFIFSNSHWEVGDEKGKVLISGLKNNFGGGIVIKNTNQISNFKNTEFKYLSGVENRFLKNKKLDEKKLVITSYIDNKKNTYLYNAVPSKNLTYILPDKFNYSGAINFYKANVSFENCTFLRIDSEDSLNIILSKFLITNSTFKENSSDSVDIDFGFGEIKKTNFISIGNDAIDLSGSEVYLENLFFSNISDKIISAGENTNVSINKVRGTNSYIGIASKDGSTSIVTDVNFKNVKIPFASYQKKKSFAHAVLKVNDPIYLENYFTKNVKDKKSNIYINNKKIQKFNDQVSNIIYKKKLKLINAK